MIDIEAIRAAAAADQPTTEEEAAEQQPESEHYANLDDWDPVEFEGPPEKEDPEPEPEKGKDEPDGKDEAPEEEAEEEPAKEDAETFTLKVDGEEVEKSREELVKLAQKGLAADKRFEEAAALKKSLSEVDQIKEKAEAIEKDALYFRDRLIEGPIETWIDIVRASGQYSDDQVYDAALDLAAKSFESLLNMKENPDARRAKFVEQENARLKARQEEIDRERAESEREREIAAYNERLQDETIRALEDADLPVDEDTITEVAQILIAADDEKIELTAKEAVERLKDQIGERRRRAIEGLTYEDVRQNEALIKEFREKDLAELKERRKTKPGATAKARPGRKPKTHRTFDEVLSRQRYEDFE